MICKICNNLSTPLFKAKILNKHTVQYYKCRHCEFIQTEKPYWLADAYNNAIADLDVGLVYRNLVYAEQIFKIIINNLDAKKIFLDYAGGYGLFVRIMRDKGLDYVHYDKYCKNIFAKNHGLKDISVNSKFEGLTALEVYEHLEDPISDIKEMLQLSDTIIFSTELIPNKDIQTSDDWWYFIPETGQHIAFYSQKTLDTIASMLKLQTFTHENLHIFTMKKLIGNPFIKKNKIIKLESLLNDDFILAKNKSSNIKIDEQNFYDEKAEMSLTEIAPFIIKIDKINKQKVKLKMKLADKTRKYNNLKVKYNQTSVKLRKIINSKGWHIILQFYKFKSIILKVLGKQ